MTPAAKSGKPAAHAASSAFAEEFVPESDQVALARRAAREMGLTPASPGTVALLTFLARSVRARTAVEIGTGSGVSGLALLAGMAPDGVLTSIDPENEHQVAARQVFTAAAVQSRRFRLIAGAALTVLPKLSDAAYDLVSVDGDPLEYVEYVAQALRLLRPGGILVLHHALWRDLVADADNEDDEPTIIREALEAISAADEFTPVLLPVGDGILAAIKA